MSVSAELDIRDQINLIADTDPLEPMFTAGLVLALATLARRVDALAERVELLEEGVER